MGLITALICLVQMLAATMALLVTPSHDNWACQGFSLSAATLDTWTWEELTGGWTCHGSGWSPSHVEAIGQLRSPASGDGRAWMLVPAYRTGALTDSATTIYACVDDTEVESYAGEKGREKHYIAACTPLGPG